MSIEQTVIIANMQIATLRTAAIVTFLSDYPS